MLLEKMTMEEYKKGLKKTRTLIVPYGSVEAHGTHLPLSTDTLAIVRAARSASEKVPVFVAPPVHYGHCASAGRHPGTISITPETLRRLTMDIVRDASTKGIKNFILVTGHGGSIHTYALKEAAEELTEEIKGIRIAALRIYEILPKEAAEIAETRGDAHAGEIETSLIMHLAPELQKGRGEKGRPKLPSPIFVKDKLKYWPGAVNGDPTKASREKGESYFNLMVDSLVKLVHDIESLK